MIEITDKEFNAITTFIKSNYGINLIKKRTLIEGRLGNYIEERGFNNFSAYMNLVFSDKSGKEMTTLINKLTTNLTFFLREPEHFNLFRDEVLPHFAASIKDKDLRIWSAGCSSGEEPYTLAMIVNDFFGTDKYLWDTKILATDISEKVLTTAQQGIYPEESTESIPRAWKLAYFNKLDNGRLQVSQKIRNEVIYRFFNLLDKNFPFKKKFHTIFCRNVMIYFDKETKNELINRFYDFTEDGGFLFVGHSESITKGETRYKYIMPSVYRKL